MGCERVTHAFDLNSFSHHANAGIYDISWRLFFLYFFFDPGKSDVDRQKVPEKKEKEYRYCTSTSTYSSASLQPKCIDIGYLGLGEFSRYCMISLKLS